MQLAIALTYMLAIPACRASVVATTVTEAAPAMADPSANATTTPAPPAPPVDSRPAAVPAPSDLRLPTDVQPLDAKLTMDLDPSRAETSGTIAFTVDVKRPVAAVWLHAVVQIDHATLTRGGSTTPLTIAKGAHDRVSLVAPGAIDAGRAVLTIAFRGKVETKTLDGLFANDEGGARYVFTDFEPQVARRAFPCFDEPGWKHPWTITLRVPAAMVAVANNPITHETRDGDHKIVEFETTRPLPSYLVAFAVGPFEIIDAGRSRHGVPLRVIVPRGRKRDTGDTVPRVRPILDAVEDELGLTYPFAKLDLLAIPDFGPGAMENPGLITFKLSRLLVKHAEFTRDWSETFTNDLAHELAHMWFGALVTPAWWDDVWLNESFATWLATKVLVRLHPEWHAEVIEAMSMSDVMAIDALPSARKVRQPIRGEDDIDDAFDDISYSKGAAILKMIEHAVGPEVMKQALGVYIAAHTDGTATYADFVAALSSVAGHDIADVLATFVEQSGVPFLKLDWTSPDTWTIEVSQLTPFGSTVDASRRWQLPFCPRVESSALGGKPLPCTWLTSVTTAIGVPRAIQSFILNDDASGYYHASVEGWNRPVAPRFSDREKIWLIGEASAQLDAGVLTPVDALALGLTFADDANYLVVEHALAFVVGIEPLMESDADKAAFAACIDKAFGARARKLGWTTRRGDSDDVKALRAALLPAVALYTHDPKLVAEAKQLAGMWLDRHTSVAPELVDGALDVAAQLGDAAFATRLIAALRKEPDRDERRSMWLAISRVRVPALIAAHLDLVLDATWPVHERYHFLHWMGGHADTAAQAWAFVLSHWDALVAALPRDAAGTLGTLAADACTVTARAELVAHRDQFTRFVGGSVATARALEAAETCIARKAKLAKPMAEALQQK